VLRGTELCRGAQIRASCTDRWGMLSDGVPAPRFMTPTEVAADLRISPMTVYRLIHSGELPAIRIGRNFRVAAVDLDAFLSERAAPIA